MTYLRFLANFRKEYLSKDMPMDADKDKYIVTGEWGEGEEKEVRRREIQKIHHKVYALVGWELRIQNDV
ncbi:MAG: hypothetical protein KAU24_01625, partial [Candidatus Aenigmarchaeota archaeon]|nr:hypothetical protein [Candidatus Aenigmarchaeota archaeon]